MATVSFAWIFGFDIRIFVLIIFFPTFVCFTLSDAAPIKLRQKAVFMIYIFYLLTLIIMYLGLFNQWINITESTQRFGGVYITLSGLTFNSLSNLIVYGVRNITSLLINPNHFVILNSCISSQKINLFTVKVLKLGDKIRMINVCTEEEKKLLHQQQQERKVLNKIYMTV